MTEAGTEAGSRPLRAYAAELLQLTGLYLLLNFISLLAPPAPGVEATLVSLFYRVFDRAIPLFWVLLFFTAILRLASRVSSRAWQQAVSLALALIYLAAVWLAYRYT